MYVKMAISDNGQGADMRLHKSIDPRWKTMFLKSTFPSENRQSNQKSF